MICRGRRKKTSKIKLKSSNVKAKQKRQLTIIQSLFKLISGCLRLIACGKRGDSTEKYVNLQDKRGFFYWKHDPEFAETQYVSLVKEQHLIPMNLIFSLEMYRVSIQPSQIKFYQIIAANQSLLAIPSTPPRRTRKHARSIRSVTHMSQMKSNVKCYTAAVRQLYGAKHRFCLLHICRCCCCCSLLFSHWQANKVRNFSCVKKRNSIEYNCIPSGIESELG